MNNLLKLDVLYIFMDLYIIVKKAPLLLFYKYYMYF